MDSHFQEQEETEMLEKKEILWIRETKRPAEVRQRRRDSADGAPLEVEPSAAATTRQVDLSAAATTRQVEVGFLP